jgi:hypothetical protein
VLESKGTAHGKHFSLQLLMDALQTHIDNVEKVWKYDQRATNHWCKVVGGAQKHLPAHVVNEYCRGDRAFEPCPTEWESKLSQIRELKVWDGSSYVEGSWFTQPSSKDGLGLSYAAYRWRQGGCRGRGRAGIEAAWRAAADLMALQSLWKTRTQQLDSFACQMREWLVRKSERAAAVTDFFLHSEQKNFPKEVISLISDYEFEMFTTS